MKRLAILFGTTLACSLAVGLAAGQAPPEGRVRYVSKPGHPANKALREENRVAREARHAETQRIRDAQAEANEKDKKEKRELRFDFDGVRKPASLDAFESAFHFPPLGQSNTGTCWCFSTTSFFESEVNRLTGRKIKLSEMHTVYYEYLEKARRFVRERGDSYFDTGSEGNAVMLVWRAHGIVPAEAYPGTLRPDQCHDEEEMLAAMKAYLAHVKANELWDEELVLASLRLIMDRTMGRPPERFVYAGVETTPQDFLANTLPLNLDNYVCVMSTLASPFHAFGQYDVEANWWQSRAFYNVPLDEFYRIIRHAVRSGYTVRLNGDITEPGHDDRQDAAIIPSFDIPRARIDQAARELRFFSGVTTDDHDVHLVGHTTIDDVEWYLIKDSFDAVGLGQFDGYMFYREDYIRLKTLTYIVHEDALKAVVTGFKRPA